MRMRGFPCNIPILRNKPGVCRLAQIIGKAFIFAFFCVIIVTYGEKTDKGRQGRRYNFQHCGAYSGVRGVYRGAVCGRVSGGMFGVRRISEFFAGRSGKSGMRHIAFPAHACCKRFFGI